MTEPSKKKIKKLGEAIRTNSRTNEDEALLDYLKDQWTSTSHDVQRILQQRFSQMNVDVFARAKNIGTIRQKLMRDKNIQLTNMRDLVGCRVVGYGGQYEQRFLLQETMRLFQSCNPKVIDRIKDPQFGYRAIHVAFKWKETNVEVQIRTNLQHVWAESMERLGDIAGRDVRYVPDYAFPDLPGSSRAIAENLRNSLMLLSEVIGNYETASLKVDKWRSRLGTLGVLSQFRNVLIRRSLKRKILQMAIEQKSEFEHLREALL
jgi:ppGpp synthetase/RelA/SpoT-type nucleotidyltranferase